MSTVPMNNGNDRHNDGLMIHQYHFVDRYHYSLELLTDKVLFQVFSHFYTAPGLSA